MYVLFISNEAAEDALPWNNLTNAPALPNSNALAPELTFTAWPALPSEVKPVPPYDTGIVGKFVVGTEPVTFDDDKSIEEFFMSTLSIVPSKILSVVILVVIFLFLTCCTKW